MADLKYPEWQRQYEAVLMEFDPNRVRELADAAVDVIFARFQGLSPSTSGEDERQAIADAINALYIIKTDTLKFAGQTEPRFKRNRQFEPCGDSWGAARL